MNEAKNLANEEANEGKPQLRIADSEADLGLILDIPVKLSVELGRTKIVVQELLKLHKGSVLELNKPAGDPVEVLINGRVVARGEVVVLNEKFGIRLTEIVSHSQRIRQLGEE